MRNKKGKFYCFIICIQCFVYMGYILCQNQAHNFFSTEKGANLEFFLKRGNKLFSFYVMISVFVLWKVIYDYFPSFKRIMMTVNIYHIILYSSSFVLEILLKYVYFKWTACAIQMFLLLLMVNVLVLFLYLAQKFYFGFQKGNKKNF